MCVKYTAGNCIPDSEMDLAVFHNLLPSLPHADTLILNGIGESLLHPRLSEIIGLARERMVTDCSIGLQSNGLLLDRDMAHKLIKQGLTTICLSIDSFEESPGTQLPREHSFNATKQAVKCISWARKNIASNFSLGLEIVLARKNIRDLPGLIIWAADNGVDYILTSHLILYDQGAEDENIFNPYSSDALYLFRKYNDYAASQGFDFIQEYKKYRKYAGTRANESFSDLFLKMNKEARERDIQFNFDNLDLLQHVQSEEVADILALAKQIANKHKIELVLPPLQAFTQRKCRFIDDQTTFIDTNGNVMPCHFLWHTYSCRVLSEDVLVPKRIFGNICNQSLESIWQSSAYVSFREEASQYEYASCWTCPQGPCPSLVNDKSGYANDCYGSNVPCGHCQWNLGGIRCL